MKYQHVITFVKRTNLTEFTKPFTQHSTSTAREMLDKHYAKERDVTLHLYYRFEQDDKGHVHALCKIQCPINPMPVKGEFETPSIAALKRFFAAAGWTEHNYLNLTGIE